MKTKAEVMDDLKQVIATFENREFSDAINEQTRFFADLGFVSIEAVVLGEKLDKFYDTQLPFPAFLKQLAQRNVQDIQVGELAEFVCESLNQN